VLKKSNENAIRRKSFALRAAKVRSHPAALERFIVAERPEPTYLRLLRSGELERRVCSALDELASCTVCPRDCRVDRLQAVPPEGELGVLLEAGRTPGQAPKRTVPSHIAKGTSCFTGRYARVASAFAHFGEEDCLRGWIGSGTIFFSFCNLRCVFCQNWDISQAGEGREVLPADLAEMMLDLQERGCHNVNFVTPEHVVPQLLEGLLLAAEAGLRLPVVYNTSAYDSLRSLELLDGVVDIYMPDFKYWDPANARRYLKAEDYPEVARRTIREMHRQVGPLRFDRDGLAVRGLLVRHLVMPGALEDAREIFRFLAAQASPDTYVNIMGQYRPAGGVEEEKHPKLSRRPDGREILAAREIAEAEGLWRFDERWRGANNGSWG
jgi:putative pyruvate formate lyase activating enzyme